MNIAATANPGSRQEELGQFLTARPVADFMGSMFGPLPRTVGPLAPGGQLVGIAPRSYCNGPYFRPFREDNVLQAPPLSAILC